MTDSTPPPPFVDPISGFCWKTKTFHSLRPTVPLTPATVPLTVTSYAFSLLPSPLPSHPALLDAATGATISFSDLLSQSRSLAASLRAHHGLSPGHVALILSLARLEIPALYFALLSLGIVVSPANPASTPVEIAHLCRLSNSSITFAVSAIAAALPRRLPTLLLDSPEFQSFLTASPNSSIPDLRKPGPCRAGRSRNGPCRGTARFLTGHAVGRARPGTTQCPCLVVERHLSSL